MQTDGHHAPPAFVALTVQPVEGVAAIDEEILAGGEVPAALQPAVVAVGHDEVGVPADAGPVGKIVVVGVAVVEKAAGLDHEPPSVRARTAGVPAEGPLTGEARDDLDVAQHVGALGFLGDQAVVDPALAVTGDLEAAVGDRSGGAGIALERHTHRIDGGLHPALAQNSHDLPEAYAAAVFEIRLDIEIASVGQWLAADVGQHRFGVRIAVQYTALAPLLVVEHEGHGDSRLERPAHDRRAGTVTDEIARILPGRVHVDFSSRRGVRPPTSPCRRAAPRAPGAGASRSRP